MKKISRLVFPACLLLIIGILAQASPIQEDGGQRIQWIKANGVPIRSADADDADFSDLMPLVDKIGGARVVLLGEQSHGDGTVFLMKARLVRFLHEVMGFDVMAWESGLYDCREMDAALRSALPLNEAIRKGIFAIWNISEQVPPVFAYSRTTHGSVRPLEMAGFDCQFSSSREALESFPRRIAEFFDRADASILSSADRELIADAINFQKLVKMTEEERIPYLNFVKSLPPLVKSRMDDLRKVHDSREIAFWLQVAENTCALQKMAINYAKSGGMLRKASDVNVRDEAMGKTLVWLANKYYAGRKIVVWAASFHNMRGISELGKVNERLDYTEVKNMGDWVYEALGEETYNITFTAYQGRAGAAFSDEKRDIPPAPEGSIEDFLHQAGNEFMFLDFRSLPENHWLRGKLPMRPLGYTYMTASWPRHFDAVIYTETMEPSMRIKKEETAASEEKNK